MIKKSSTQSEQDTALQLRYGKIGIGAVAAAAPYQGGGKRPLRLPAISSRQRRRPMTAALSNRKDRRDAALSNRNKIVAQR